LPRQSGWRDATVLSRQREWRGNNLYVEIVVGHGRSCRADARGAAACFSRAIDLGAAKRVKFEHKKAMVLYLEFVLRKC